MSVLNVWRKLRANLTQNEGFYLLPSLIAASATLVMLTPSNGYGWGLFGVLLVRLLLFRSRPLLLHTLAVLLLSISFTWIHLNHNVSHLSGREQKGIIRLDPNHLKLEGDWLQGLACFQPDGGKREEVAVFYQLSSLEEKQYWSNLLYPVEAEVTLQLQRPEHARNLHQFDYRDYLAYQGIHWKANIRSIEGKAEMTGWHTMLPHLRLQFLQTVKKRLPPGQMKSYLLALLFNEGGEIRKQVMEDYRKVGIIHLFSISGLHIQFLLRTLRLLLLRLHISRENIPPVLLVSILLYGFLTGGGIGIFRALFTAALLLAATMLGYDMQAKDAFAMTLTLALLFNPYLLFNIAFQLSYVLSGVLYFLGPTLLSEDLPPLQQGACLSVIMTAVSFPILSYHFFEISWIGMFVNIFYAYFFSSWLLPLFWVAALLVFMPRGEWLINLLALISETGLEWLEKGVAILAESRQLSFITGRQRMVWYILAGIVLLLFLRAVEQRHPLLKAATPLLMVIALFYFLPFFEAEGKVVFIDVGQGDAILLKAPHQGGAVLIDTGGKVGFEKEEWAKRAGPSALEEALVSTLKAEAIRHLDAVILTHSDADHIGSMGYLVQELPVERLYFASGADAGAGEANKFPSFLMRGTVAEPILAPHIIEEGHFLLEVLWPEKPGPGDNRDSLVLFANIGGLRWLFTGDMETEEELQLIRKYPHLAVDVLKVGHHGSATSSNPAFLQQLTPDVAVISVGAFNRYGHPAPDVLQRLNTQATELYRTDRQGAIHYAYRKDAGRWEYMLQ